MTYAFTICILKTSDSVVSENIGGRSKDTFLPQKWDPSLAARRVRYEQIMT
jgi:hypothetical protein